MGMLSQGEECTQGENFSYLATVPGPHILLCSMLTFRVDTCFAIKIFPQRIELKYKQIGPSTVA